MMNHLLESSQLSSDDILHLLKRATYFKQHPQSRPQYPHITLANLFYEPSTRTRVSFEMAAHNLGIRVINFDSERSSETKGEMIEDTLHTLFAMGITLCVIRHKQSGLPKAMAGALPYGLHVINAGDGTNEHPSQGLLDLFTIAARKPDLAQLKIAIVGDLLHSRVANTLQSLCAVMNVSCARDVAPARVSLWSPYNLFIRWLARCGCCHGVAYPTRTSSNT